MLGHPEVTIHVLEEFESPKQIAFVELFGHPAERYYMYLICLGMYESLGPARRKKGPEVPNSSIFRDALGIKSFDIYPRGPMVDARAP